MKCIFIVLIISILLISCDDCQNDCPPNAIFQYTLIDSIGNNLFTINDNAYNPDSLKIMAFRGTKEIFMGGLTSDNVIFFQTMENIDSVVVNYGNNNKDVFTYQNIISKDTECCGSIVHDYDMKSNTEILCSECADTIWNIEK